MSFNERWRGLHFDNSDVSMQLKIVGHLGKRHWSCEPN